MHLSVLGLLLGCLPTRLVCSVSSTSYGRYLFEQSIRPYQFQFSARTQYKLTFSTLIDSTLLFHLLRQHSENSCLLSAHSMSHTTTYKTSGVNFQLQSYSYRKFDICEWIPFMAKPQWKVDNLQRLGSGTLNTPGNRVVQG